jgi:hypothetical protein
MANASHSGDDSLTNTESEAQLEEIESLWKQLMQLAHEMGLLRELTYPREGYGSQKFEKTTKGEDDSDLEKQVLEQEQCWEKLQGLFQTLEVSSK